MEDGYTILIVDDQLSAREVLRGLLKGQGYILAFAQNGVEALAQATELRPDLVLLDVMMPGMNGFEICRRFRSDPVLAEMPVVMVTALDDFDARVEGIEAGADDFLTKPINATELLARVRTTTRLNRYRHLLSERAKFEWVVEQANDGYLILNHGDDVLYANSQARQYLNLSPDEHKPVAGEFLNLAGKQYNFEPETTWSTWPELPPGKNQALRYLVRPETPSSNAFWLQVNTLKLPAAQNGNWMVHIRDVTANMDLQRDMWKFEALISHKLRTPLAGLVTGLDILNSEGIANLLSPQLTDFFDVVYRSAQRLQNEVQRILAYVNAPPLTQSATRFNLSQLQPTVAQIKTELELETIHIRLESNYMEVSLSKQAVELILQEVLENSKKFHPQHDPDVDILVTTTADKRYVKIQISDNGLTLSPELLEHVWTPYYQSEKYFTGEVTGMGLGLSRVALWVWGVGGQCRLVNCEPGPGVTVELTLPCQAEDGTDE